jgi:protein O-GlcNAc transferase
MLQSILHIHPDFDRAVQMLMEADEHAHMFLFSASSRRRWKDKLASRLSSNVTEGRVHFFADVDVKQETLLLITADAVIASLHLTRPRAAFQAFTAGVPVVALPGELWASRITYSFYREMGISELIATSLDDYVALAHKLANNGSFHDSMAHKVKTQRTAIANNRMAVNEWERFLDFAGARIYPSGDVGDLETGNGCSFQEQLADV